MFDKLIKLFESYTAAKLAKPYNGDYIQGQGMAFATEWNARKADICAFLSVKEDDCDYMKYATYMPLIVRGTQNG